MEKEDIIKYVKENLLRGFSIDHIRKQLLSHGHSRTIIDPIIHRIKHEQIYDIAKYINKELKFGLKPHEIRNYLIAIGHKREQVDEAIKKILLAKRRILEKKKSEAREEKITRIKEKIRHYWHSLKPWQKGGLVGSIPVMIISFISVIIMMLITISDSGKLNCYSLGRVITCSLTESIIFYALLFIAFVMIFCIPAFLVGALINHLIWRYR